MPTGRGPEWELGPLTPMSTRGGGALRERQRRVGHEGAVDDVREPALESSERLGAGVAVGLAALEVGDRVGESAGLGDRDPMQGGVQLTVAASREPVAAAIARPDRQRRRAVVAREGVAGAKAHHPGDLADDLGRRQGRHAVNLKEHRCDLRGALSDLPLMPRLVRGRLTRSEPLRR